MCTDKLSTGEGLKSSCVSWAGRVRFITPTDSLGNLCLISLDRGDCYQKAREEVPSGTASTSRQMADSPSPALFLAVNHTPHSCTVWDVTGHGVLSECAFLFLEICSRNKTWCQSFCFYCCFWIKSLVGKIKGWWAPQHWSWHVGSWTRASFNLRLHRNICVQVVKLGIIEGCATSETPST